ncbi:VOC family protein [uncultured Roseobacter sp.]|uniref:VOC family protein n=1 Tax=uncultured Roseobacter sp. TaxID=114847 RepID=UPI0026221F01|nr:VOC family protein [uncultured Roseobacter sp.]
MQIDKLDHVNLRTSQLDRMVKWYTEILGLNAGYRPAFPFPGAWLYAGDTVVIHLVGVSDEAGAGSEGALKMEHFAFRARGAAKFEATLKAHGETYRRTDISEINTAAFNVWDPDGNHIHVDFYTDETTD